MFMPIRKVCSETYIFKFQGEEIAKGDYPDIQVEFMAKRPLPRPPDREGCLKIARIVNLIYSELKLKEEFFCAAKKCFLVENRFCQSCDEQTLTNALNEALKEMGIISYKSNMHELL